MFLKIAVTGSSGFIGSVVIDRLAKEKHHVGLIIRPSTPIRINRKVIRWNIDKEQIDLGSLEGYDAVIHLAGTNIAAQRWSASRKDAIQQSRVKSTDFLCRALKQLKRPPAVLLSASAVGFYGYFEHNDEVNEDSPKGDGFLSDVCQAWEEAAKPAEEAGVRVVHMRLGMVLGNGGALAKMLPIFRAGLGGRFSTGRQVMSWVAIEEIPPMMLHVIGNNSIKGAVNFVSPNPVTNAEFTGILGRVLRRPTFFGVPVAAAHLMFGEMADELLLGGAKVLPRRLMETGYQFTHPDLRSTLEDILSADKVPARP